MILEVLGQLVQREFFWLSIHKVWQTGESIKGELDEAKASRIEEKRKNLIAMGGFGGFASTHVTAEEFSRAGVCALNWPQALDLLHSNDVFTEVNDDAPMQPHRLPNGQGWFAVDHIDDVWLVVETGGSEASSTVTVRCGIGNADDDWVISTAVVTRDPRGDDLLCGLIYYGEAVRPNDRSLKSLTLGLSNNQLSSVLNTAFEEFVAEMRTLLEQGENANAAIAQELSQLIQMRTAGHLTDEEFGAAKQKLLGIPQSNNANQTKSTRPESVERPRSQAKAAEPSADPRHATIVPGPVPTIGSASGSSSETAPKTGEFGAPTVRRAVAQPTFPLLPPTGQTPQTNPPPASPKDSLAGWFPDPSGRYQLRFWNGSQWTEHVATKSKQRRDAVSTGWLPPKS